MSHVATVQIEIRDLRALGRACDRLGLELATGEEGEQSVRGLGVCAPHLIRVAAARVAEVVEQIKSKYGVTVAPLEIGVFASATKPGTFELRYETDLGGYGLELLAGDGLIELKKANALETARQKMTAAGFRAQDIVRNGRPALRFVKN